MQEWRQPLQPQEPVEAACNDPLIVSKRQLEELINCHICYDKVRNATMCPNCSKLYCQGCIRRCMQNKQECPNCRKSLKTTQITNCSRFISELSVLLEDLIEHKNLDEKCIEHGVAQNYYCRQCQLPICCECEMFGEHKGHAIEQLKKVYEQSCEKIREQLALIKKHMRVKEQAIRDVQQRGAELRKEKDRRLVEIQENTQFYRLKILNEVCSQEKYLKQYQQLIGEEIQRVEEAEKTLKRKLAAPNKLAELTVAEEQEVRELCQKEFATPNTDQKLNFINELIPPYQEGVFVVEQFNRKMREKAVVYSPIMEQEGLEWRLKVYPNGNETVEGTHLSVFLELVNSIRRDNLYQYQIELLNQRNPESRMLREYNSNFEPAECWGYNKYIKLDALLNEGYLLNDTIILKYYVRQPSYYQVSVHKAIYSDYLDREIARQEEQIKHLEELRMKQSTLSSQ